MQSVLEYVRSALEVAGASNSLWPCYIGYFPDDPNQDRIIGLMLFGGLAQDTLGLENLHDLFQLKIRSTKTNFAECYDKWLECFNVLQRLDPEANGMNLIHAMSSGPITWYDENLRPCMSVTFKTVRRNSG